MFFSYFYFVTGFTSFVFILEDHGFYFLAQIEPGSL